MSEIKVGALYKTIKIDGARLDIYYGFYNEREKELGYDPTPIYPNLDKNPQYTKNGLPIVAVYKDTCEHFNSLPKTIEIDGCINCKYFDKKEDCIGLCRCEHRRIRGNSKRQDV